MMAHAPSLVALPEFRFTTNPAEKLSLRPLWRRERNLKLVGRIREDESIENGLNFWCVADEYPQRSRFKRRANCGTAD